MHVCVKPHQRKGIVGISEILILDGYPVWHLYSSCHDQPAIPSDDVEEREEEEVPLRHKRSAYRRARTAVAEPAGPSVAADKGKAPMHDLDIPTEFLAEDAQARKCFEEEQASERLVQHEQKKRALADLRYRALKGKPLKKSEVTQLMRNLVKNQWCAAHNDALKRSLLSAQYNLFRLKPAMTDPPSKDKGFELCFFHSQLVVPAATTHACRLTLNSACHDLLVSLIGRFVSCRLDLLLLRRRMNRYFRLNPDVDVGLDLWRNVNLLCLSLHSDEVEDFWRTQDEWITDQTWLKAAYECLASAPIYSSFDVASIIALLSSSSSCLFSLMRAVFNVAETVFLLLLVPPCICELVLADQLNPLASRRSI
ncbi:hypothetical protein Tco_0123093 [Tanacetum coccineum]